MQHSASGGWLAWISCAPPLLGALLVGGCEAFSAGGGAQPLLHELRAAAAGDTGSVLGIVRLSTGHPRYAGCTPERDCVPLAGARVQLGVWRGDMAFLTDSSDTWTFLQNLKDERFEVVAETVSGPGGEYKISGVPRRVEFMMRVIPPRGLAADIGYIPSVFQLGPGGDSRMSPELLRTDR